MSVKKYGELKSEEFAKNMQVCRDIVKSIVDYGVNQRQLARIIKLLSLEIEDRDFLEKIAQVAKEFEEKLDNQEEETQIVV